MIEPPRAKSFEVFSKLPSHFVKAKKSLWGDINLAGRELGCFLEGPAFDVAGNLLVVDIPFGRIFRIAPSGQWSLVTEYDGWPNGMKIDSNGTLLVADHKLGLLRIDPSTGNRELLLDQIDGMPLLGLNDLTIGPDGKIYTTDQGQTGLHDPRGRVLRVHSDGAADLLIGNGPSPNGLVFDAAKPWLYVAMTRANAVWRVPLVNGAASKVGTLIQLSGGLGPDGLAMDRGGNLIVAHPPLWVWRFDSFGRAIDLWEADEQSYVTNIVTRIENGKEAMYATDSITGRIFRAEIEN